MTVIELSLKIVARLSAVAATPIEPVIDSINAAVQYVALKLADVNSDLAVSNFSGSTALQTIALPATYNGFRGKPLVGLTQLDTLPQNITGLPTTAEQPLYYDVSGTTMYLYPTPLASVTVTGEYWGLPAVLAATDTVPYFGKFDALLADIATKLSVEGFSLLSQQSFMLEVREGIESVVLPRRPALPRNRPFNAF